jgi:dienelactone hydrolase
MNVEFTNLAIQGFEDQPVPNQFVRQRDETATLTVLLPGLGYTCDMPLFYYAEWIALERGWDVLRVDYDYHGFWSDASTDERKLRLKIDVDAALIDGLRQRDYGRVVLVGKSLGTRAMVHLLDQEPKVDVWNVWLTPLINDPEVREQIERNSGNAFVAIGTEDSAYDHAYLQWLTDSRKVDVVVVGGADHSMDISGDIFGSIAAMGRLVSRLDGFLPEESVKTRANP